MRSALNLVFAACLGFLSTAAHAAHTQARLILSAETARPGDTVLAGIQLKMDPHWHTYWTNPGVAGKATTNEFDLPPGITAGAVQWPMPKKMPPDDLISYVYDDEVVLIVPLKLAPDLTAGPKELKAKISWLECISEGPDARCVPGSASVSASLQIATETK